MEILTARQDFTYRTWEGLIRTAFEGVVITHDFFAETQKIYGQSSEGDRTARADFETAEELVREAEARYNALVLDHSMQVLGDSHPGVCLNRPAMADAPVETQQ